MAGFVNNNIEIKPIGFGPILQHYLQKCRIADIINRNVPLDARRTILTHGQASIAMITAILFQVMSLYKVCKFAKESNVLDIFFPDISPDEFFNDRPGDTLNAIYKFGISNLELLITRPIIELFEILTEICHNDTTYAQFYGENNKNRFEQSIKILYGYSKQYRKDLKQLVWSMTAGSNSSFFLFQQAYSGNTADVETYVEQRHHLIDLRGKEDFLFAGNSKEATHGNMAHIDDHGEYFLSPLPMYASYQEALFNALDNHDHEVLIPYKDQMNRYKVEHLCKRSKSGHKLEPIYLQTPDRIEAYLFLFKIAIQILVLMEKTARTKIVERDKGLDNFMPNKRDIRNPKTENMLAMFEFVVCGVIMIHAKVKQTKLK